MWAQAYWPTAYWALRYWAKTGLPRPTPQICIVMVETPMIVVPMTVIVC